MPRSHCFRNVPSRPAAAGLLLPGSAAARGQSPPQCGKDESRSRTRLRTTGFARQVTSARGSQSLPRQRDPSQGQRVFRTGRTRPPVQAVKSFIDELSCARGRAYRHVTQIAPSRYRLHAQRQLARTRQTNRLAGPRSAARLAVLHATLSVRKVGRQLHRAARK